MTDPDRVLHAIGVAARRRILELLAAAGPQPVSAITAALSARHPMSQPAVSQHLKVLREAGIVAAQADGRRHLHAIAPGGLDPAAGWITAVTSPDNALMPFAQPLDALATEVARGRRARAAAPESNREEQTA